jgi:hypothetical protein
MQLATVRPYPQELSVSATEVSSWYGLISFPCLLDYLALARSMARCRTVAPGLEGVSSVLCTGFEPKFGGLVLCKILRQDAERLAYV